MLQPGKILSFDFYPKAVLKYFERKFLGFLVLHDSRSKLTVDLDLKGLDLHLGKSDIIHSIA